MDAQEAYQQLLSDKNLRDTQSRRAIMDHIFSEDKHFSAEQLLEELRGMGQAVSKATVYRTLSMLAEGGLILEHDFNTGEKIYEVATDKPHHDHFYCDRCGKIVEFYEPLEEDMIHAAAKKHDFEVTSHVMKIYGLCGECRRKK